jgi:hypothetical protein
MTYRSRSILFYILVLVFILGGTLVVLYSQGWRIDTRTAGLTKVGALYVKTFPKDALLKLDGDPIENKSWLLRDGTLIDNLFPRTYTLDVEAPGYKPWHQTLAVKPSLVSERKYVVLVPEEPAAVAGTTSTKAFWLLPDTSVVRRTAAGTLAGADGTLPGATVAAWSDNAQYLLLRTAADNYALYDARRATSTVLARMLGGKLDLRASPGIAFAVTGSGEIVAHTSSTLIVADPRSGTNRLVTNYPAALRIEQIALNAGGNTLAWSTYQASTKETRVTVATLASPVQTSSFVLPTPLAHLAWIPGNRLALLGTDGVLNVRDANGGAGASLDRAAEGVDGLFLWAPENDVIVVRGDKQLLAIPLTDEREAVQVALKDIDKIQRLEWYRDIHHVLAFYADRVDLIETDPGAEQTVTTVIDAGTDDGAAYDRESNMLYALKGSELAAVTFPKK